MASGLRSPPERHQIASSLGCSQFGIANATKQSPTTIAEITHKLEFVDR